MPNFHTAHNLDLCSSQLSAGCRSYLHLQSSAVCWRQIWKWEPNSFRLIIIIHSPPDSDIKLWGRWDSFTSWNKKTYLIKNFCVISKAIVFLFWRCPDTNIVLSAFTEITAVLQWQLLPFMSCNLQSLHWHCCTNFVQKKEESTESTFIYQPSTLKGFCDKSFFVSTIHILKEVILRIGCWMEKVWSQGCCDVHLS